ncbi:uncharacterized protein [Choristoneura fumiferana]|uniref:uncharacterized protein n=1 Tax=Choristoneura fumiferana TaxID=7141 RepID=UPI003D15C3C0
MLRFVIFALLVALAASDSQPEESRSEYPADHDDHLYLQAKLDGKQPSGPVVARTLHSSIGHGPDIEAQDEIIRDVYSPTYHEPLWVLDYRFLKSGGRKYVRGPGGQILILPKSYVEQPGDNARDYDSLIEHLRLKMLNEHQKEKHREENHGKHAEHWHY